MGENQRNGEILMTDLDPNGIHNLKPRAGASIMLGNGNRVLIMEPYEIAVERWKEDDDFIEFTAFQDFAHTDERATYRMTIPRPLLLRVDELSEAFHDAVERDDAIHKAECERPAPEQMGTPIPGMPVIPLGGGMAMQFTEEGIVLEREPETDAEGGESDDGNDDPES